MAGYLSKNDYGMELVLDLYGCDPQIIRSEAALRRYVDELCNLIRMEKYGDCYLPYFGLKNEHTAGYSLLQFIETSSITGHFSEGKNAAYINIFSCREFDPEKATAFTKEFFKARRVEKRLYVRH